MMNLEYCAREIAEELNVMRVEILQDGKIFRLDHSQWFPPYPPKGYTCGYVDMKDLTLEEKRELLKFIEEVQTIRGTG
jgi:hypothetical protein